MPNYLNNEDLILIGTGPMSEAYAKVLQAFNISFKAIGRGEESANKFNDAVGIKPITGGIEKYLDQHKIGNNTKAIIATGTESLLSTLLILKKSKITNILIEKPAAISIEELLHHTDVLNDIGSSVFVAYNRRFYSSVIEAKRLIEEDGGLQTMHFEFTEWSHRMDPSKKAPGVYNNWFFANSSHVVDMAFFIAGNPQKWNSYVKKGSLEWHPVSNFTGAGITESGVLFSYLSNWESAGRWGVELLTEKRRIYLKPLEEVQIQERGKINIEKHIYDDSLDKKYKPGVYLQVKSFLENSENLLTLKEHILNSKNIFSKILSGS